ncbi:monooxygenase [Pigmentiphaga sp. NML080357]|uniref:FAD-dependent monooxygenase n=1 Tax=Pigmentiphaga sp. NML080357 TaxID=2008675 RepID=UPI000B42067D|nr:FAD-dependent monooxygenase [Pigmentiphaga sp. NML080357]OVZ57152.1 monooxygenase [Pigmentiphaga sp. NML080357]
MHQPDTTPRKSIFFDYRIHPFSKPADFDAPARQRVIIIGAGPVGLVTALYLARMGVPCVLATADVQVSEGSRALAFTRRSMEILQQVGAGEHVVRHGLPWQYGNSYYRGRRVFRLEIPYAEDDAFAPLTNLQQQLLEEHLVELIDAEPLVDLRWGTRFEGLEQDDDGVTVTLDTPAGPYRMAADWLVATDGAKSSVRQSMKLRMEGDSYEGRFVIVDVRVDLGLPTERLAFFDPDWNPGNTILMHRQPHGLWRFDYQVPAEESSEAALSPDSIRARVNAQLAMIGHAGKTWEMDWASIYSARAMTLPRYRYGRVLFAGDAAHMLPIFGVRGLNTGWQDAQNLAWKLALVAKGRAAPALLDSYSAERVAAAREIIDEASKSARFMTPPTHGFRLLRDATLSLSLSQAFVRPLLHWRTSRPHEYTRSPLNTAADEESFAEGPRPGATAPNVRLDSGGYLLDRLGPAFHLLCFCQDGRVPAVLAAEAAGLARDGIPVSVTALARAEAPLPAEAIDDRSQRAHRLYGADGRDAVYLLRPDQHVAARWRRPPSGALTRAVRHMLECEEVPS